MTTVANFIRESNAIEGILRDPTDEEIAAAHRFMNLFDVSVRALNEFQSVMAPGKPLRTEVGMDVQVGGYVAPAGGPNIEKRLIALIKGVRHDGDPWKQHCRFEMLHPYMDGNGRTGRMLWAWQMRGLGRNPFALPFLHRWYYQTLEHSR